MNTLIGKITIVGIILVLACNICLSQERARIIVDIPTNQKPWNHVDLNNSPSNFQFAIVTDRTGSERPGVFMDGINKLNLLQPEFVMSVGDLIEGYTEDTARLNAEWKEFMGFIDQLDVPFFYVPGNHDITNQVMEDKWNELFGVTYYHFVYNDVLFLCLNSEDHLRGSSRGTIGDEQYEYVKKVLEENEDVKWTLVFLHQPLWIQDNTIRWPDVERLLKKRKHNVFAGHYHRYFKMERNKGNYIALATTGGGSRMRGRAYGEFDHVVWVTMTDEGPIIANLFLEGIWDEDVVTEEIIDLVRQRDFPVSIEPRYLEDVNQSEVSTEIRVTNTTDMPMKVKFTGYAHPKAVFTLDKEEVEVSPNSVEIFQLRIPNQSNMDLTDLRAFSFNTHITYTYEEGPDLIYDKDLFFLPMRKRQVTKAKKKVVLDGDFKDWTSTWIDISSENVRGNPFDHRGSEDCSIKFSTMHDDDKFYLAFDISDDEVYVNEERSHFRQDALILALDARPEHISAANKGLGRHEQWMLFVRSFNKQDPVYRHDLLPPGVESSVKTTKSGLQIEVAVPMEYMNKMQLKPWTSVRLGIGYYDYDKSGEERTEMFWFPAWDGNLNLPGSGMLFKEQ